MKNSFKPRMAKKSINPKKARGWRRIEPITATRKKAPVIVRI
jgi:hypothetical protein